MIRVSRLKGQPLVQFITFVILISTFNSSPALGEAVPSVPSAVKLRSGLSNPYLNGSAIVTWTAVIGVQGYRVLLTDLTSSTSQSVTLNGDAIETTTFSGLRGGSTYTVQVRSLATTTVSAWSTVDTDSTLLLQTKPNTPSAPTAVADVNKARVTWTLIPAAENGGASISKYLVTEVNSGDTVEVDSTTSSVLFTGLSNGATAIFTVAAINSVDATGSVSPRSESIILPDVPSLMTAPVIAKTSTTGEISASWVPPASNGGKVLTDYVLLLQKDGLDFQTVTVAATTDLTYKFASLLDASYTLKIKAVNEVGSSVFSVVSNSVELTTTTSPPSGGGGGGGGSNFVPGGPTPTPSPSASPSTKPNEVAPIPINPRPVIKPTTNSITQVKKYILVAIPKTFVLKNLKISAVDAKGKNIKGITFRIVSGKKLQVVIPKGFKTGTYVIRFKNSQGKIFTQKIVVARK